MSQSSFIKSSDGDGPLGTLREAVILFCFPVGICLALWYQRQGLKQKQGEAWDWTGYGAIVAGIVIVAKLFNYFAYGA